MARIIIEKQDENSEAVDIFVIALNIIVAMGHIWGLELLEAMSFVFELLDDWMILLINGSFFYRLVHVIMVPSF